jgi:hypothetical protein
MEKKQNWYVNPKKYHFIYKTTCQVNGKYYYGMHSTDNLEDGYVGSGTRLWRSIKKYGRENFKIEILEFCSDRESLKKRERELINEEMLVDPMCMNLTLGGDGSWVGCNKKLTKEHYFNLGKLGGFANLDKLSDDSLKRINDGCKKGGAKAFKGLWRTNRKLMLEITNRAIIAANSQESNEKRKNTLKAINHQQGDKNSQYNTCWIFNISLKRSKKIKREDIEKYLIEGWTKGRKINF